MTWQMAALLLLGGSTVLLLLGMPVALSFVAINIVGAWLFLGGEAGLGQVVRNSVVSVMNFSLTPIPLFVLMGEILFHTGLAIKVIDGVERLIRQVPGRLAVVAVVAGTVFSAISGSTIATTAMLGSLMLPVMLARGYHPTMATGPIMAIGAVDMLIPPSALTVLLGSLSGISISKLLIGGVVPGLILSLAFVAYIIVRAKLTPSLAPPTPIARHSGWEGWRLLLLYVVPLIAIFAVVVGAMSGGFATPTESAALGALATMAVAALYRVLSLRSADEIAQGRDRHLRHDHVHHPGRHHVLADPELLGRNRGPGLGHPGPGAVDLRRRGADDADPDLPRHLRRSGEHDADHAARLHADRGRSSASTRSGSACCFSSACSSGLLLPPHGLLLMTMRGVAPPQVTMAHIFQAVVPYVIMSLLAAGLAAAGADHRHVAAELAHWISP